MDNLHSPDLCATISLETFIEVFERAMSSMSIILFNLTENTLDPEKDSNFVMLAT